jgi:hypothetical protein
MRNTGANVGHSTTDFHLTTMLPLKSLAFWSVAVLALIAQQAQARIFPPHRRRHQTNLKPMFNSEAEIPVSF